MQLLDTVSLLSGIVILCFSFCIWNSTIWFKNADLQPRLLGFSFFPVFVFSLLSLFTGDPITSLVLIRASEPILMILFLIIFTVKPGKQNYDKLCFAIFFTPSIILIFLLSYQPARILLARQLTNLAVLIITASAVLYLLKNRKDKTALVFWSVLCILSANFSGYYFTWGLLSFISPLFRIAAFTLLIVYFYNVFLKPQLIKNIETERKLSQINRAIDLEVKRRTFEIEKVNEKLLNISKTDTMSKVLNKQALLDSMEKLINSRKDKEFSILMFDIDNFKVINDTLGHSAGDKCIKTLAALAKSNFRDFDIIGRYGGDEFIIVLPGLGINPAVSIAERFRQRVEQSVSPHYTISIGIAVYPYDGVTLKALIDAADINLYNSKHKGRNAVSHKSLFTANLQP